MLNVLLGWQACGVDIPQATQYDQQTNVVAYPTTPLPYGSIPVEGSAGGLSFPLNVHQDSQFTIYDGTFNRPVNITFQGMPCTSPKTVKQLANAAMHPVERSMKKQRASSNRSLLQC